MNLGDIAKTILPAAIGAFAGPAAGAAIPGLAGMNPFLQRAIMSGGIGLLTGQKPKDAILSGLMGGGIGAILPTQGAEEMVANKPDLTAFGGATGNKATEQIIKEKMSATGGVGTGTAKNVLAAKPETMSGELLKTLGFAGEGEGNLLFKLMNTKMGEGLAAGLLAQLLSGDEDEGPGKGSFERRAFGAGGPGGKLGGINYADGGEAYFPRRNGGIDPSEGSGKKDDVPAMLMAGEFVMTRDAVKGAGNGNLRKGIQNMYNMMDNFERMA